MDDVLFLFLYPLILLILSNHEFNCFLLALDSKHIDNPMDIEDLKIILLSLCPNFKQHNSKE